MVLNSYSEVVRSCWEEITDHFTGTELSASIVMPNHFHGIILINNPVAAQEANNFNRVNLVSSFFKV